MNNDGHRERLRKRFADSGMSAFSEHEKIELLLTFAIPRKDTKNIAKDLLSQFKSVENILNAQIEDLQTIKGLGKTSAILIKLVRGLWTHCSEKKLEKIDIMSSPENVIDFARMKLGGNKNEALMLVFVDAKNQVIHHEICAEGTVNEAVVYPREVAKKALAHHASGVIAVHNHPSNICTPSSQDKKLTAKLVQALELFNIRMLDHLIIGKTTHFSFAEEKIL
ncbi:MAG: DNA repair protein RadC [Verrucomicrobiota bacterium]|nr:DNA repair protein RadC [Verrucomicrobiota bacterium]